MTAVDGARAPRLPREQRRQQVLTAALEVFSTAGYHAASMDDIAERAGVSKPVLYQHFTSKLDLYLDLLDLAIEDLLDAAKSALTHTHDNRERVSSWVNSYFGFVENPNGAFRLFFENDLANDPRVRSRIDDASLKLTRMAAAVIAEDTGLSQAQAMLISSGLHGMVQYASVRWLRNPEDAIARQEAADLLTALAWRGIGGFPLTHPPHDDGPKS